MLHIHTTSQTWWWWKKMDGWREKHFWKKSNIFESSFSPNRKRWGKLYEAAMCSCCLNQRHLRKAVSNIAKPSCLNKCKGKNHVLLSNLNRHNNWTAKEPVPLYLLSIVEHGPISENLICLSYYMTLFPSHVKELVWWLPNTPLNQLITIFRW